MSKFTDAVVVTLKGYFNAGDQPTEAQFAALITAIQEGIEEHDHDGTGDGDGIATIAAGLGVGLARTEGTLHVHTATAGVVTADASGDDLVVENSGSGGISILVPDNQDANILFGSASDPVGSLIRWEYDQDRMMIGTADVNGKLSLRSGNAVEAVEISATQQVGIGCTPAIQLDVEDNVSASYAARFHNAGNNVDRHVLILRGGGTGAAAGTTYFIYAQDGAAAVTGSISTVDGVFTLTDASDERRKTKIKDTKLVGLDIVNGLKVRDYNWKANPKGPVMTSFVAQEAQKVFPAMVVEAQDETLMTARAMLIPILTKAIQELDVRLTTLGG